MKPAKVILLFALLSVLVPIIGGCGGGGTSTTPAVFEPNYVSSLNHLAHWQSLPVKIYFAVPGNWTTYYPADLSTTAGLSWNQPGQQAFIQVVGSQGQADVVCTFVDTPPPQWEPNVLGMTNFSINLANNEMVPGTVSVTITMHYSGGGLLSQNIMQAVIAHELGHSLGIDGHSPNSTDLLYAYVQSSITIPQIRDLNTARTAYALYFGGALAPPSRGPDVIIHRSID